jgi:hypothetical protein
MKYENLGKAKLNKSNFKTSVERYPNLKVKLGMLVQAYNPNYSGGSRRIMVQGQPRQKHKTLPEK